MFKTQQEMDRNAKRWLAVLIPAVLAFGVLSTVIISLGSHGDAIVVSLAKLFSGH